MFGYLFRVLAVLPLVYVSYVTYRLSSVFLFRCFAAFLLLLPIPYECEAFFRCVLLCACLIFLGRGRYGERRVDRVIHHWAKPSSAVLSSLHFSGDVIYNFPLQS